MVIVMECHETEIITTIQSHIYCWMEKMRLRDLRAKIIQIYQEIPSFASIVGRINMLDWESTMPF